MKTLRAENIVKEYKGRKVVKGISLEVKQGEIIGLLGPNGAGKTTSFYMIVGFIKPNAGHIFLNDPLSYVQARPKWDWLFGTRAQCV